MQTSGWTPPLAVYVPEEEQQDIDLEWMKVALDQVSSHLHMLIYCRCTCQDSCTILDIEAIALPVLIGIPFISCSGCAYCQAEEALAAKEVPVGCVFVKNGKAIAKARNRTNEWRNVSQNEPSAETGDKRHVDAGNASCRVGVSRRDSQNASVAPSRRNTIRYSRAVRYVCVCSPPSRYRQGILWCGKRAVRRLWQCA